MLHAEVDQVVGDRPPAAADLAQLVQTDHVVREVLRLWPAAPSTARVAPDGDEVLGRHIPPGATILLSPYATQRSARWWPEPERFDPGRFDDPLPGGHRYAWYPFGAGAHACVGMHLALMEAVLGLATLLQRFEVSAVRDDLPVETGIVEPAGRPRAAAGAAPAVGGGWTRVAVARASGTTATPARFSSAAGRLPSSPGPLHRATARTSMPSALPRRARPAALLLAAAFVLSACVDEPADAGAGSGPGSPGGAGASDGATVEPVLEPVLAEAEAGTAVLTEDSPADLSLATSQLLFERAPVLVVAPADDPSAGARAAAAAVALGMPALVVDAGAAAGPEPSTEASAAGPEPSAQPSSEASPAVGDVVGDEVTRLGATTVLLFGDLSGATETVEAAGAQVVRAPGGDEQLSDLLGVPLGAAPAGQDDAVDGLLESPVGELRPSPQPSAAGDDASAQPGEEASGAPSEGPAPADGDPAELPRTRPAQPGTDLLVMTTGEPEQLAAVATARAAGADLLVVPGGDPRRTAATVEAVAAAQPERTVGLGSAFGDGKTLGLAHRDGGHRGAAARRRPARAAGQDVRRAVRQPITASLGVLGEQGPEATIERARTTAEPYQELTDGTVVPALEIIATVASGSAGRDGNYSNEWPVEAATPPGRAGRRGRAVRGARPAAGSDRLPHPGPAVRGAAPPAQRRAGAGPGVAAGPRRGPPARRSARWTWPRSTQVVTWLADLTREQRLPQKLLVLHQFQVRMIPGVDTVDQSRSEVAVLIHVDGQGVAGGQAGHLAHAAGPRAGIDSWGWKNFYDEDVPMLTPEQTMQVEPQPDFISYQ